MSPFSPSLILLCDLVNYSLQDEEQQHKLIRELWSAAMNSQFFPKPKPESHMWGTGDGFYLVDWESRQDACGALFHLAEDIMSVMGQMYKDGIRVALHFGLSGLVESLPDGRRDAAGSGLNEAQRMLSLAAPNQIILSEPFFLHWPPYMRDADLVKSGKTIHPAPDDPPTEVYVKHWKPLQVRFDSEEELSDRMVTMATIMKMLQAELAEIALYAELQIREKDPGLRPTPRVSIFRVSRDAQGMRFLRPTRLRWCSDEGVSRRAGYSKYAIDGKTNGLGRAFVECTPLVVWGLPAPEDESYIRKVAKAWDLDEKVVERWGRKPRSIFAIPLRYHPAAHPMGVVCIDFDEPLSNWNAEDLEEAGREMEERISHRLPLLWSLLN